MKKPIGVFDSGLGGLTVVRQMKRFLPEEDIVYFGDTARVPYGSKSRETVTAFSRRNCAFLLSHGVKMIVVACNTSSAMALHELRRELDIPIYDVITPGARDAVKRTKVKKIGVIGTYGTVSSRAYELEISNLDSSIEIYSRPCPLFVPLAEEGWIDRPATVEIAREYLLPLKVKGIDVLIMGCTHYPVFKDTIRLVMGGRVNLIDSGESCARSIRSEPGHTSRLKGAGRISYFVSDMPERFREVGRLFMGEEIQNVEVVSMDEMAVDV